MNKVSDVLAQRFSQDLLEAYYCKQHPPGTWIVKLATPLWLCLCQDFLKAKSIQANSNR